MKDTKPTEPGEDLRLTLDANIQDKAEEVLADVGASGSPRAPPRSSWTRATARCSRSPTGRG